jgi:hypothetical protein
VGGPGAQWPESSISPVNGPLFWKALGVQAVAVAVLFGVLVALPLDGDFFEDWGFVAGPIAWLACSVLTARVLSLPTGYALFAALAGGAAGTIVLLLVSHAAGMAAALAVFAASCGSYDAGVEEAATQ